MYSREPPVVTFNYPTTSTGVGGVIPGGIIGGPTTGLPSSMSAAAASAGVPRIAAPSNIEELPGDDVDGDGEGTRATASALPAPGWSERLRSRREYTMLKKVVRLLQDNRAQSGDEETAQKLNELNRTQTESFPILKTILNGIFITTGVILLVGVVAVIVYTSLS